MKARSKTPKSGSPRVGAAAGRARALAQTTLLAAGVAVTQLGGAEMDSRFHLFNPELVDRLRAPITRLHE
jgi:hypothetical protein